MKEITAEGVNRNLQPNTEKLSSRQSRRREAREQRRRAHWTKIDRKTGSPSLIPEGEEANCVCRENETVRDGGEKDKRQQRRYQK